MSAGAKLPRSKMTCTIGSASTINPTSAGTISISIMRSASAIVRRIPSASFSAACRETAGNVAVAIDTPNRPIGTYISRKA